MDGIVFSTSCCHCSIQTQLNAGGSYAEVTLQPDGCGLNLVLPTRFPTGASRNLIPSKPCGRERQIFRIGRIGGLHSCGIYIGSADPGPDCRIGAAYGHYPLSELQSLGELLPAGW